MMRTRFAALFLAALYAAILPGPVRGGEAARPNSIFLLVDDPRFDDLGCMGNRIIQTPNLDRLAADGVIFDNAFVTTAICCASRASILTGPHTRGHGIEDFAAPLSSGAMELWHTNPEGRPFRPSISFKIPHGPFGHFDPPAENPCDHTYNTHPPRRPEQAKKNHECCVCVV